MLTCSLELCIERRSHWPDAEWILYPRTHEEYELVATTDPIWSEVMAVRVIRPFAPVSTDELPILLEQDLGGVDPAVTVLVVDTLADSLTRRLSKLPPFAFVAVLTQQDDTAERTVSIERIAD